MLSSDSSIRGIPPSYLYLCFDAALGPGMTASFTLLSRSCALSPPFVSRRIPSPVYCGPRNLALSLYPAFSLVLRHARTYPPPPSLLPLFLFLRFTHTRTGPRRIPSHRHHALASLRVSVVPSVRRGIESRVRTRRIGFLSMREFARDRLCQLDETDHIPRDTARGALCNIEFNPTSRVLQAWAG